MHWRLAQFANSSRGTRALHLPPKYLLSLRALGLFVSPEDQTSSLVVRLHQAQALIVHRARTVVRLDLRNRLQ